MTEPLAPTTIGERQAIARIPGAMLLALAFLPLAGCIEITPATCTNRETGEVYKGSARGDSDGSIYEYDLRDHNGLPYLINETNSGKFSCAVVRHG
jgi:hypothetical protein